MGALMYLFFYSFLSCLAFWGLIKGFNLPQQLGNCDHYEGKIPYETSLKLWPLKTWKSLEVFDGNNLIIMKNLLGFSSLPSLDTKYSRISLEFAKNMHFWRLKLILNFQHLSKHKCTLFSNHWTCWNCPKNSWTHQGNFKKLGSLPIGMSMEHVSIQKA